MNKNKEFKKDALKYQSQARDTLSLLKKIIKKAIQQSNSCSHLSTSEWVQVRIIAAKTYLLEK